MSYLRFLLSVAILSLLFQGCKKPETQPQAPANLLADADFESYPFQQWPSILGRSSKTNPNTYAVEYSIEDASSPTHSIKVSADAFKNDTTFQYIGQSVLISKVPIAEGAKLTMKAKIKTVSIQGNGISIAIGGNYFVNGVASTAFYTSTEGKTSITGTSEFKEYTITFDSVPKNLYSVYALVFYLPKTTGTAYYDDISLTVN